MFEKSMTPKPNRQLESALEAAKSAIEKRRKIEAAIDTALRMQPAIEGRLQSAMENLGAAEAESVLSDVPADRGSLEALVAVREAADGISARITGLRKN